MLDLATSTMAMGATNGTVVEDPIRSCSLYVNGGGLNDVSNGNSTGIQSADNSPDDEIKVPSLVISDLDYNPWTLQGLSKLRRNRQFCDVILQVLH